MIVKSCKHCHLAFIKHLYCLTLEQYKRYGNMTTYKQFNIHKGTTTLQSNTNDLRLREPLTYLNWQTAQQQQISKKPSSSFVITNRQCQRMPPAIVFQDPKSNCCFYSLFSCHKSCLSSLGSTKLLK